MKGEMALQEKAQDKKILYNTTQQDKTRQHNTKTNWRGLRTFVF